MPVLTIPTANLLANDLGQNISVVSVTSPSAEFADVVFDPVAQTVTYSIPLRSHYAATDTFQYTIQDRTGQTSTATVTIKLVQAALPASIKAIDDTRNVTIPTGSGEIAISASSILGNDTGSNISIVSVQASTVVPMLGSVRLDGSTIYYTPPTPSNTGSTLYPFPATKSYSEDRMIFHSARRKVYYVDYLPDGTTPALHVYDLDSGARLSDITLTGPAAGIVAAEYNFDWQGGGSAITGLFDVKVVCDDFMGNYVIDLRAGYCEKINNEYGTSMFWYEGDENSATLYQSKALEGSLNWRKYSLVRNGSGAVVVTTNPSIVMLQNFGTSEPPGYFDAVGRSSVVGVYDRTTNKNHVVLWGSANGNTANGIILDHKGPDGWQCVSAISFEDGAILSVIRNSEQKLMKFNKFGAFVSEALVPKPVAQSGTQVGGQRIEYLKGSGEAISSRPSSRYIGSTNLFRDGAIWDLQLLKATYFIVPSTIRWLPFDGKDKLYYDVSGTSNSHGLVGPGDSIPTSDAFGYTISNGTETSTATVYLNLAPPTSG
jgi:hypothetical protein